MFRAVPPPIIRSAYLYIRLQVLSTSTAAGWYRAWMSSIHARYQPAAVLVDNFTLDAGLLARSQYPEGPATGYLDTGFSWFPSVYKQMLRWFPKLQVATTCFSCGPPDLNLLVTNFIFCIHVK